MICRFFPTAEVNGWTHCLTSAGLSVSLSERMQEGNLPQTDVAAADGH